MLNVCKECGRFGTVISAHVVTTKAFEPRNMPEEFISEDCAGMVRVRREQLGLRQEELGQKVGEKVSIIQKIESGSFSPTLAVAKKIEQVLRIKLVEVKIGYESSGEKKKFAEQFTIGDKIRLG